MRDLGTRLGPQGGGLVAAAAAALLAGAAVAAPGVPAKAAVPTVGPYKDVSQHAEGANPRMAARVGGGPLLLLPDKSLHGALVIWAFATGECGSERYGPFGADRFAAVNVPAFVAAGVDYVVSTGGEAGAFTCAGDDGMRRFVARIDSPRLKGIDFDIERQQTAEQVDALVRRAKALHRERPRLRLSFTLATHAASDGSRRSLNALGETVIAALRRHRLIDAVVINLMVMNYGPAEARWCVPDAARTACDMGASALQAARNLNAVHGVPYSQIALTVMAGENDVAGNVFTPADAATVAAGARALGLEGLHWWSLDRDQPCPAGAPRVSPQCHALPGLEPGAFGKLLAAPR